MKHTKDQIVTALRAFINQRSGIDARDYGDRQSFASEAASIKRAGEEARELLRLVETCSGITAEHIAAGASSRERLTFDDERGRFDYTTGQYFPTEYRAAAARLCASLLWAEYRERADFSELEAYDASPGSQIRQHFREMLSPGMAGRWFDWDARDTRIMRAAREKLSRANKGAA